jgi:hypothetical protein
LDVSEVKRDDEPAQIRNTQFMALASPELLVSSAEILEALGVARLCQGVWPTGGG